MGTGAEVERRPAGADAAVFLATFGLILAAMAGVFSLDLFLAGLERRERRSEGRHYYSEGVALARQGRLQQAVDRFQSAVAAERTNPLYQRGLAEALAGTGRLDEAGAVLAQRLQREPTDGAASLLLARVLVREGKRADAVSYYHRAIYGRWDENTRLNRVRARFELVDLLATMGPVAQRELLGELLPLEHEAGTDVATRRRIAHLFLEAGAPAQAATIYRELLQKFGGEGETLAGLGEAELARGNYRSAEADLTQAAALAPGDSSIARRLELVRRVILLDPTQRGVGGAERYRRSLVLLSLTLRAAEECAAPAPLDSARLMLLPPRAGRASPHESVERNLDWSERLWKSRPEGCAGLPGEVAEPVERVLARVEQ